MIPFLTSFRTVQVSKIVRVTIVRYIKNVEIRFGRAITNACTNLLYIFNEEAYGTLAGQFSGVLR